MDTYKIFTRNGFYYVFDTSIKLEVAKFAVKKAAEDFITEWLKGIIIN